MSAIVYGYKMRKNGTLGTRRYKLWRVYGDDINRLRSANMMVIGNSAKTETFYNLEFEA